MNLEEKYKASTNNTKPKAYSQKTKQDKDNSKLNVDITPKKYKG
jgi:hypothetical protein